MERQLINGTETRRRGEIIEQKSESGLWKPTNNPAVLESVREIEYIEMMHRNPVLYREELKCTS